MCTFVFIKNLHVLQIFVFACKWHLAWVSICIEDSAYGISVIVTWRVIAFSCMTSSVCRNCHVIADWLTLIVERLLDSCLSVNVAHKRISVLVYQLTIADCEWIIFSIAFLPSLLAMLHPSHRVAGELLYHYFLQLPWTHKLWAGCKEWFIYYLWWNGMYIIDLLVLQMFAFIVIVMMSLADEVLCASQAHAHACRPIVPFTTYSLVYIHEGLWSLILDGLIIVPWHSIE